MIDWFRQFVGWIGDNPFHLQILQTARTDEMSETPLFAVSTCSGRCLTDVLGSNGNNNDNNLGYGKNAEVYRPYVSTKSRASSCMNGSNRTEHGHRNFWQSLQNNATSIRYVAALWTTDDRALRGWSSPHLSMYIHTWVIMLGLRYSTNSRVSSIADETDRERIAAQ